jgi:5-methylcytosine-specific restriction endonuclease McrA
MPACASHNHIQLDELLCMLTAPTLLGAARPLTSSEHQAHLVPLSEPVAQVFVQSCDGHLWTDMAVLSACKIHG